MTAAPRRNSERDRRDHQRAERVADQRIKRALILPGTNADNDEHKRSDDASDQRQHKVLANALERGAAPCQHRTDAGEEEQKESDRYGDAVVPRRSHRDLIPLYIFREHREKRAPKNREAGGQQNKIIEEEARLTRDQRFKLVFRLQMVALQHKGEDAHREHDHHEDPEPRPDIRLGESMHRADQP